MSRTKISIIFIFIFLVIIFTYISTLWIERDFATKPPIWAYSLSWSILILGSIFMIWFGIQIYKKSPFSGDAVPKTKYFAFQEMVKSLADFKEYYEQLKFAVKNGWVKPGTEIFNSHINEMRYESKIYIRNYFKQKVYSFMKMLFLYIICIILIFSCLYTADYTIDTYLSINNNPGFSTSPTNLTNLWEWRWESVYFSVLTLVAETACPAKSPLARGIVIFEVLNFLFIFTIGFNFALVLLQSHYVIDPDDLADVLQDELEKEAGGIILEGK